MSIQCPKCPRKLFNEIMLKGHLKSEHPIPPDEHKTFTEWRETINLSPAKNSSNKEDTDQLSMSITRIAELVSSASQEELDFALVWYSKLGDIGVCDVLLTKGANVNAEVEDFGGRTSLKSAMIAGEETARFLLTRGANIQEAGLLQVAALYGHIELVKLLLMAGAEVEETTIPAVQERGEEHNKKEMLDVLTKLAPQLKKRNKDAQLKTVSSSTSGEGGEEKKGESTVAPSTSSVSSGPSPLGHIMLSYQWDDQPIIVKIKEGLVSAGFAVWLDLEQMGGSTLEAMANAVENSAVVCVGLSEKYKNSANCRLEGEYTQQQRKIIVPLMMQKNYRPTGWLGMLLGAKLYFDFSDLKDDTSFQRKLAELVKQLRSLNIQLAPTASTTPPADVKSSSTVAAPPEFLQWSPEAVSKWIASIGGDQTSLSHQLDGACLGELQRLRQQDPSTAFVSWLLSYVTPHLPTALKLSRELPGLR